MSLPRLTFLVELDSQPGVVHTVDVRPADQMVGEQAGQRFAIAGVKDAPLSNTYLWVWAAMRRTGLFPGEWPEFYADAAVVQPADDDELEQLESPDPTPAAASATSTP